MGKIKKKGKAKAKGTINTIWKKAKSVAGAPEIPPPVIERPGGSSSTLEPQPSTSRPRPLTHALLSAEEDNKANAAVNHQIDNKVDISALQTIITECGSGDHDHGPRKSILQEIFSYLDIPSLKEVRLVCKAWEDAGSIILGKRCRIQLHRICSGQTTTDKPMDVNPKLIQCISLFSMAHPANGGHVVRPINNPYRCFNSFASMWHDVVQELIVGMDMDTCVGLPKTLNTYGFANLTKMTITELDQITSDVLLPLRPIDTLKELKIMGHYLRKSCRYPLLQSLIYSAHNLEVLHIEANFYPNLVWCKKLKVLNFSGSCLYLDAEKLLLRDLDPAQIFRILNEVGQHLEHLTLQLNDFAFRRNARMENVNTRFPILPKLQSLILKGVDLLEVEGQICSSLFPNLELVNIHLLADLGRIDQVSCLTHKGVKSLGLLSVDGPNLLTLASRKFPNVKRLVIRVVGTLKEGNITGAKFLGTILEACSTWKLLFLEIQMCKEFKLSQFLVGLTSLTVLEGLKEVKIVSCLFDTIQDDLDLGQDCQEFKEIFQLSATMDRMVMEGLTLEWTNKETVLKFLQNHKELPVLFLDRPIKRQF